MDRWTCGPALRGPCSHRPIRSNFLQTCECGHGSTHRWGGLRTFFACDWKAELQVFVSGVISPALWRNGRVLIGCQQKPCAFDWPVAVVEQEIAAGMNRRYQSVPRSVCARTTEAQTDCISPLMILFYASHLRRIQSRSFLPRGCGLNSQPLDFHSTVLLCVVCSCIRFSARDMPPQLRPTTSQRCRPSIQST